MALRRFLGSLSVAALVVFAWTACSKTDPKTATINQRCEKLAKACGDKDTHAEKISDECKQAAVQQVKKGCTDKAIAVYDCYEKELCGKTDKVWALDDLRVLADRQKACVAERDANRDCVGKK